MPYPWSALLLLAYLYAIVTLYVLSISHKGLRVLYSDKACIITMAAALVMVLFFGFTSVSRGPVYYVVMLSLTATTGLSLASDIHHLRSRAAAPVMAHLGVFVVMVCGIFGYADKQTVKVTAFLDTPVSEGVSADGMSADLPLMLTLKSFDIDRYPVRLELAGPDGTAASGESVTLEGGSLGSWRISVLRSFDMGVRMPGEEDWQEMRHIGAEPAAYVRAEGPDGSSVEGWVACGSFMFEPSVLSLPDGSVLQMREPAPRRFSSMVSVTDRRGHHMTGEVAVNHPMRLGSWRIYQAGYDTSRGRWSGVSILQCVRDPWYPAICVGIWIIFASALVMMATGGRRRKEDRP